MDQKDSSFVVLNNTGAGPTTSKPGHSASAAGDSKPWNQPGANRSDYFNYHLDETTWKMYMIQQLQKRVDALKSERQARGLSDFSYY